MSEREASRVGRKRGLSRSSAIAIAVGIAAYLAVALGDSPLHHQGDYGSRPAFAAAATLLMAIWWLTEAVPIYLTACLPLVLFPATGVFGGTVAHGLWATVLPYADAYIFLFMGGMCIAAAMQQWNLHRRIALHIMRFVGTDPKRLLLGFLVATAFISLWISNTATAAMMLPIGVAVIRQFESRRKGRLDHYGAAIMLAIAYAANVGGIGTKIGTAPNALFAQFMNEAGVEVTFARFAAVGVPFVMLFLPIIWMVLWRVGRADDLGTDLGEAAIEEELRRLGPTKRGELIVLGVFIFTALVWIAGKPVTQALRGALPDVRITSAHVEGGVAMLAALVLLSIPVQGRRALELGSLRSQPWATLVLLGGSFSMAEAIQESGLSLWVGGRLVGLSAFPPFLQVLLVSGATVLLSAVASNTATTTVMLNVLKGAVSPTLLGTILFSATIAASCDFALPAGTPPNAIVFASGYVTIPRMAKTGALLDVAAAILASIWCSIIVRHVL